MVVTDPTSTECQRERTKATSKPDRAVLKNIGLIERADRRSWPQPSRQQDSEKKLELLTRSMCVKKRMAVWDNAPSTRHRKSEMGGG